MLMNDKIVFEHVTIFKYYQWLLDKIPDARRYSYLLWKLFKKEFTFDEELAPRDVNRIHDVRDFIKTYLNESAVPDEDYSVEDYRGRILLKRRPSVLEAILVMCIKGENFVGSDVYNAGEWFWLCMENLRIRVPDIHIFEPGVEQDIDDKIDIFLRRDYDFDGTGSMFPSDVYCRKNTSCRTLELWYQFQWYLSDVYFVDL